MLGVRCEIAMRVVLVVGGELEVRRVLGATLVLTSDTKMGRLNANGHG